LVRGVTPLLLPSEEAGDLEALLAAVRRASQRYGWEGRRAVFLSHDHVWTDTL
jgi:hypothetical protein